MVDIELGSRSAAFISKELFKRFHSWFCLVKLRTINDCSFGDLNYTSLTLVALSEEESEEEAPPPKKTPAKATPAKKAPAKAEESDDDDEGMSLCPYLIFLSNTQWKSQDN